MRHRLCGLLFLAFVSSASVASAADPKTIIGSWIERFPNGKGMVADFEISSASYYAVDASGQPATAPTQMPVHYKDLGGEVVGVNFDGGGSIMLIRKSADAITMDFPGVGAHELTRLRR